MEYYTSHHTTSLPIEILQEIVLYLPRHILRSFLPFQPHPLGRIASYIYFSSLTLHFGVYGTHKWHPFSWTHPPGDDVAKKVLEKRHEKRSHEILEAMIKGGHFTNNVQTLKISAPGCNRFTMQMDQLNLALCKLTRLKTLECTGNLLSLRLIIEALPETVPHLKSLKLSDCMISDLVTNLASMRIRDFPNLDQLVLCGRWYEHISLTDLPGDLQTSKIKKLHINSPFTYHFSPCIPPALIGMLTHLSLRINSLFSTPLYGTILQAGVNLRSLRIETPMDIPCAQYFRQYVNALPYLTEFGIYLRPSLHAVNVLADTDFFPAVCDFLLPKAEQLIHLELKAPTSGTEQNRLGFNGGKVCWGMFKSAAHHRIVGRISFSKLECLSMTLPAGRRSLVRCSTLIPRGVTRLALSENKLSKIPLQRLFQDSRFKKRGPHWPDLRFISVNYHVGRYQEGHAALVRAIAEVISTVRVIKLTHADQYLCGFWSVRRDEHGGVLECRQWDPREATVMVKEVLDLYDCQDTSFEEY